MDKVKTQIREKAYSVGTVPGVRKVRKFRKDGAKKSHKLKNIREPLLGRIDSHREEDLEV